MSLLININWSVPKNQTSQFLCDQIRMCTVNRGIGRPKLTVSVKLVKSLLFAVGVVIYQNDGKDVYFAELLSDFMCMRFYWLQSWIKAQIWKIVFWGNSRPPTKISFQRSLLAKTVNFKWLSDHPNHTACIEVIFHDPYDIFQNLEVVFYNFFW